MICLCDHFQDEVERIVTIGTMRKRSRAIVDVMEHNTTSTSTINPPKIRKILRTISTSSTLILVLLLLVNVMTMKITHTHSFHWVSQHKVVNTWNHHHRIHRRTNQPYRSLWLSLNDITTDTTATTSNTNINKINDESRTIADTGSNSDIQRYKEEAAKIRLEAEKMDLELAMVKMQTLQNSIQKLMKKLQQAPKNNTHDNRNRNTNTTSNQIRESMEQIEGQIRTLQQKIGSNIITGTTVSATTLPLSRSGSGCSTRSSIGISSSSTSNGTFVASATTLGKSDVPLVVSIDQNTDTIVLTSSGSVVTKSTRDTSTTGSVTSTMTRPSRMNAVPKTTATTTTTALPRKSSSSSVSNIEPPKQHNSLREFTTDETDSATMYGFDQADLDLYVPVAVQIEASMANATAEERLEKFRTSPMLQSNFQNKLTQMFVEPIQEMNRIQELKQEYLDSTSSKEKELLKRQIDSITKTLDAEGPFLYSDSVYRPIPELSTDEMNDRIAAMQTLPDLLQTIYKQRFNLDSYANLTLAILLDHYEVQLQLLEQIKLLSQPFTAEIRCQIVQAIESLPVIVRDHVASVLGLKLEKYTIDDLIAELSKDDDDDDEDWWDQLLDTTSTKSKSSVSKTSPLTALDWSVVGDISTLDEEGNDIEMIDRSRYVYDFYPAIARMEQEMISYDTVNQISKTIFDSKKSFMVTNQLERVVGGYYIRGRNLLDEDQSGVKLMEHVRRRLLAVNVTFDEEFEYFYLRDPAPLTDEEIELEYRNDPVFVITSKNVTRFYNNATPLTKSMVTLAAFVSMGFFAIDSFHLEQTLLNQLESSMGLAPIATANDIDVPSVMSNLAQVVIPISMLQLVHEFGHRFIAWKDKVRTQFHMF